mmetsp:Transcript_13245/g.28118  ORF Transcript_13245/g.28118 Transcript_13245/m.28118 type:complete len:447 (+) Transcript_13245:297-1637(+)
MEHQSGTPHRRNSPPPTSTRSKRKRVTTFDCFAFSSHSSSKTEAHDDAFYINDLPNENIVHIATFLPDPSRALFALAITAPTSSWRTFSWKRPPSSVGSLILSSSPNKWEILDFGDIEALLTGKLTDDHVRGILECINAKDTLQTLKLTGCIHITGIGLHPLRGSDVLKQIDVSMVGQHEHPVIEPDPKLSEAVVLPVVGSIIDTCDNSLKHIQLPEMWRRRRSGRLVRLLERFHQLMISRRPCCSTCNAAIADMYEEDHTWYDNREGSIWYGLQRHTCCKCMKFFHDYHENRDDDESIIFCSSCHRWYCASCISERYDTCDLCGDSVCQGSCGTLTECDGCENSVCQFCMHSCQFCEDSLCHDCKPLLKCEGNGCKKRHCEECFDGKDCNVSMCELCEQELCIECRRRRCRRNWENACVGCQGKLPLSDSKVFTRSRKRELHKEK